MIMMRLIRLFFLLLMLITLVTCDLTNPIDNDSSQIKDLLYDLSIAFNNKEIENVMNYVHPDFLHNGLIPFTLRELWLDRMAVYSLMSIENISVQVTDEHAVATFRIRFEGQDGEIEYEAPFELSDVSYFYFHQDKWKLYGNQVY